jgi:hypothetical protein
MHFGSLQTVTAWRLTRFGTSMCQGIIVYGPFGFRLVVIEDQKIVEWTRLATASELRQHLRITLKRLRGAGWRVHAASLTAADAGNVRLAPAGRRARERHGLLRIVEQVVP